MSTPAAEQRPRARGGGRDRALGAEQMPVRAIARQLGISKNTVKRALATNRPPVCSRPAKGSAVDAVEPRIRELLKQIPTMPATVIAERIGCIKPSGRQGEPHLRESGDSGRWAAHAR